MNSKTSNKFVYDGIIDDKILEDDGQAMIATIYNANNEINGVFFRFQSWQESGYEKDHKIFNRLIKPGRKVRITMEVFNVPRTHKKRNT